MPRKRKYEEFFIYVANGIARCRRGGCSHPTMPRAQSNGMKKHIPLHHPNDYQRFLALEKGEQSGSNLPHDRAAAETSGTPPGSDSEVSAPPRLRRVTHEDSNTDVERLTPVERAVRARGRAARSQPLEGVSDGPGPLDNGDYLVESVQAVQFSGRVMLWFVKWARWPEEFNSWEPHAHLVNAAEAVADYLRELHNVFLPIVPMLQEN